MMPNSPGGIATVVKEGAVLGDFRPVLYAVLCARRHGLRAVVYVWTPPSGGDATTIVEDSLTWLGLFDDARVVSVESLPRPMPKASSVDVEIAWDDLVQGVVRVSDGRESTMSGSSGDWRAALAADIGQRGIDLMVADDATRSDSGLLLALRRLDGGTEPQFAHVPSFLGPEYLGPKWSWDQRSRGPRSIGDFRNIGCSAEAVRHYLFELGCRRRCRGPVSLEQMTSNMNWTMFERCREIDLDMKRLEAICRLYRPNSAPLRGMLSGAEGEE